MGGWLEIVMARHGWSLIRFYHGHTSHISASKFATDDKINLALCRQYGLVVDVNPQHSVCAVCEKIAKEIYRRDRMVDGYQEVTSG